MYGFEFPVHGVAVDIVRPKDEQAIQRRELVIHPKIAALDVTVGDVYWYENRRRHYVVQEILENAIRCVYVRKNGNIAEENLGAGEFSVNLRMKEKSDPRYLHSFLVKDQRKYRKGMDRKRVIDLFLSDERIRKLGSASLLKFCKEDIQEHYSWYRL